MSCKIWKNFPHTNFCSFLLHWNNFKAQWKLWPRPLCHAPTKSAQWAGGALHTRISSDVTVSVHDDNPTTSNLNVSPTQLPLSQIPKMAETVLLSFHRVWQRRWQRKKAGNITQVWSKYLTFCKFTKNLRAYEHMTSAPSGRVCASEKPMTLKLD